MSLVVTKHGDSAMHEKNFHDERMLTIHSFFFFRAGHLDQLRNKKKKRKMQSIAFFNTTRYSSTIQNIVGKKKKRTNGMKQNNNRGISMKHKHKSSRKNPSSVKVHIFTLFFFKP